MNIQFFNEDINFNLRNQQLITHWIIDSIKQEKSIPGEINFIFTSDNYLLTINKQYLSHHYLTDIITFNYCVDTLVNGDIFISIDTVKNNSLQFGVSFEEELHRVMIHGILHLAGYDDHSDEEKEQM